MRGCKRLRNINVVSGNLGERHDDPLRPLVNDCLRVSCCPRHLCLRCCSLTMSREDLRKRFLSLKGHIVVYGSMFFLVTAPTLFGLNYEQGTLTLRRAVEIMAITPIIGIFVGAAGWYLIMAPLVRSEESREEG